MIPQVVLGLFSLTLLAGVIAFASYPRIYRLIEIKPIATTLYFLAAVACIQYLYWTIGYLVIPTYIDHVEPTVAIVAAILLRGDQIYPSPENGEALYGMIYGPILYFIHAGPLLLSKTIFATKVAAASAMWCALIAMALDVWRLTRSARVAVLTLGCIALFLLKFGGFSFWNRPEPFLILLSALGVFAWRLPKYQAAVVLGVITGLAIGLKPYAAVFHAPAILALMVRESRFAAALRIGAVAGIAVVATAVAPFLYSNVSWSGYRQYLLVAAGQGFAVDSLVDNAIDLVLMTTPAFVMYFFLRPNWPRDIRSFALALLACSVLVAVLGSKNGAGAYYLLPLLPYVVYITVMTAVSDRRDEGVGIPKRTAALSFFLLYLCVLAPSALFKASWINPLIADSPSNESAFREAFDIYKAFPQAEMGVSDGDNYKWTQYRVEGVLYGAPVHLEVPYLMDLRAVGVGGDAADRLVENCKVPEWILPINGVPFSLRNYYKTGGALFSDTFREDFNKYYRPVHKGKFYTVWSCRQGLRM
ncbi:MAG: hypothetical protein JWR21_3 [Herminiimonas sp.]|nr:hypothetical protein [Herminiimonas sp.]